MLRLSPGEKLRKAFITEGLRKKPIGMQELSMSTKNIQILVSATKLLMNLLIMNQYHPESDVIIEFSRERKTLNDQHDSASITLCYE